MESSSDSNPDVEKLLSTIVKNEQEAYDLYCSYAKNVGFSIRRDRGYFWPHTSALKTKIYVCSKAGEKKEIPIAKIVKFKKSNTRTGCMASIRYNIDPDGNWKVDKLIENHNHPLAKHADQHLLRSCRVIGDEKAAVLKSMTEAGIGATDAFSYLVEEVGGVHNVGFSKRDAFNFIQKERRAKIESGDSNALVQLFKDRQAEDHMFAWDVELDEDDRLVNFFWCDGIGRLDYNCFGDVVIFDTSYRLNKYNLVCAPFVGVNHHWQNVLFGVAFLSSETIDSFTWLFRTFLRMMEGKQPITIFTDQDQAMSRAIENVFPSSTHRLCTMAYFF